MRIITKYIGLIFVTLLLISPQQANAQKLKHFQEAMQTQREFGKGYILAKKYKEDKARSAADQNGFKIVGFSSDGRPYFVPNSEYDTYLGECKAIQYEKEYRTFGGKGNIKPQDFKSLGSAYIYDSFDRSAGYGPWREEYHWRKFVKCDDIKWTGNLEGGLLEGYGHGYVHISGSGYYDGKFVFEGTFHKGLMIKGMYVRNKENYHVEVEPFSDGVAWMKDDSQWENGNPRYRYSLIDAEGHILIGRQYTAVKQGFKDGKSIVTDRGMDIVINKSGTFLAIAEGVTEIPKEYFNQPKFYEMVKIVIPKSVKKIGARAFKSRSYLKEVKILGNISTLEWECFSGCSSLRTIDLSNVTDDILGNNTFDGCKSMTSIVLPKNLKKIGRECFKDCRSLTSIIMPNSLTSIENNAFEGCSKLSNISIPASCTNIGYKAFEGTAALASKSVPISPNKGATRAKGRPLELAEVGDIIGSDGLVYAPADFPKDLRREAMVAYLYKYNASIVKERPLISVEGLAIALHNEHSGHEWYEAKQVAEKHRSSLKNAKWYMPDIEEWENMLKGCGASTKDCRGLNSKLKAAGGDALLGDYWADELDYGRGCCLNFNYSDKVSYNKIDRDIRLLVRAVFKIDL